MIQTCSHRFRHCIQLTVMLLTPVVDAVRFLRLCLCLRPGLAAESRFLRKQRALYQERHVKPRRATNATRFALVWLGRWRDIFLKAIHWYFPKKRLSRQASHSGKSLHTCRIILALLVAGEMLLMGGMPPLGAQGALDNLQLPLGLSARFASMPLENPLTAAKVALGQQLFWDRRWSKTGTVACVNCHQPDHGWSDPRQFSLDHAGKPTARHTPTIINRLFSEAQGWPGHRTSIEALLYQLPFTSPEAVVENLGAVKGYQEQFQHVFDTDVTPAGVAQALAAYTRAILSGNAPYDRFKAGDRQALSEAAQRGLALFEGKARCSRCHSGVNFTDEDYHNLGVGMDQEPPDMGRYTVTQHEADRGAFKTPTLRDVARRGPYMHDGSLVTLEQVMDFYNTGGHANPWLSPQSRPLHLTAAERADLVTFLHALSGEIAVEVSSPPQLPP